MQSASPLGVALLLILRVSTANANAIAAGIEPTQAVDCVVGNWTNITACDASLPMQHFKRTVITEPTDGGMPCPPLTKIEQCKPIHCHMSPWTPWTPCLADGARHRTRSVVQSPADGGRECPHSVDSIMCHPNDCLVSEWSEWMCDETSGKKTRTRNETRGMQLGGCACPSEMEETALCESVDLGWSIEEVTASWALSEDTSAEGISVVNALDSLIKPPQNTRDGPLRLLVSSVSVKGDELVLDGHVEQGRISAGDIVGFTPSGLRGKKMFKIKQDGTELTSAGPGDSISMSIRGISKDEEVNVGDIIYLEKEGILKPVKSFTALAFIQEKPGVLRTGYCPVVITRTGRVKCCVSDISWKFSKTKPKTSDGNPDELTQLEQAEVVFTPTDLLHVETLENCASLSRITVEDPNGIKLLGCVTAIEYKD